MISSMVLFFSRDNWGVGPAVEALRDGPPAGWLLAVPVAAVGLLAVAGVEDCAVLKLAAGNRLGVVAGAVVLGAADAVVEAPSPLNKEFVAGAEVEIEVAGAVVVVVVVVDPPRPANILEVVVGVEDAGVVLENSPLIAGAALVAEAWVPGALAAGVLVGKLNGDFEASEVGEVVEVVLAPELAGVEVVGCVLKSEEPGFDRPENNEPAFG